MKVLASKTAVIVLVGICIVCMILCPNWLYATLFFISIINLVVSFIIYKKKKVSEYEKGSKAWRVHGGQIVFSWLIVLFCCSFIPATHFGLLKFANNGFHIYLILGVIICRTLSVLILWLYSKKYT